MFVFQIFIHLSFVNLEFAEKILFSGQYFHCILELQKKLSTFGNFILVVLTLACSLMLCLTAELDLHR